jgi:hypothetical protein
VKSQNGNWNISCVGCRRAQQIKPQNYNKTKVPAGRGVMPDACPALANLVV